MRVPGEAEELPVHPEAAGLLLRLPLQPDEVRLVPEIRGEADGLGEAELDQPGIDKGPLLGEDVGEEATLAVPGAPTPM